MSLRPRASALLGLGVALGGLQLATLPAADANPAGTGLVISEAYGGGGNAGATLRNDFIELYNPTANAISVDGMSVQYRSATGTGAFQVTPLVGTVPAKGSYLVQEAAGTGGTTGLTGVDATGTIAMAGTAFAVLLAAQTDPVDDLPLGSTTSDPVVVDLLGVGTSNVYETAASAAASNTTSAQRRSSTGADTNSNAADFQAAAPTPTGSGTTQVPPPAGVCPPGPQTIAQVQGDNTATSPCVGSVVTTTGVVTSAYATGGLAGFTIQTGGADTTPDASDGIFVYLADAAPALTTYPALGTQATVTGTVTEFDGLTEIAKVSTLTSTTTPAPTAVVAQTVIPGTDCIEGSCPSSAQLNALKEKHESELYRPTAAYTVTDPYDGSPAPSTSSSFFGEIGLAAGRAAPLVAPTEDYDTQTQAAQVQARTRYNNARRVVLDDGSTTNYSTTTTSPLPYLTATHTVRVGAAVTFPAPVVLTTANGYWKIEPQGQVVGKPTGKVTFAQDRPVAPGNVGGDLELATFNVLNYFTTLGVDQKKVDGTAACSAYTDRAGTPITVNTCPTNGPRGAWDAASLKRQQDKIVNAINTMDADVVSLEEIENSLTTGGTNRDAALSTLVRALNADAGFTRWAFAPSPTTLPTGEDVIRTAFIYDPSTVARVGASQVLVGNAAFDNAREPLAQAFKAVGAPDAEAIAVVVNHFKSKGADGATGDNLDTGQGGYNGDRVRQAQALSAFADTFAAGKGIDRIFLTGDFNSYTQEDPVQELVAAGYRNLESTTTPGEKSYSFGGLAGSLDHVFFRSRSKAPSPVTGVDIWNINADESVYYEYSRFNANVTNLYDASPFRASDHNPEIVGIDLATAPTSQKVQVLATNDFHGRIAKDPASTAAGAGVLAGAVKQLRANNPSTVFAAAGDLVGASTFESFVDQDKPTIDALNAAGLDVSSVGNHEFDQGYRDLVDRIMAPESQANPKGGAAWQYIGANVRKKADNTHALAPRWTETFGDVKVGFVGAVTEHLPELVSPAGIADITVTDIVQEANQQAAVLKRNGADIVVLLVHEGASSTAYADAVDPTSDFGTIVDGVDGDVDAIVSGHTHLAYNHAVPVPEWIAEGRPVTTRPVVSAGQYGSNLNQLVFTYDDNAGEVVGVRQRILALKTPTVDGTTTTYSENYPTDAATQAVVDRATANAEILGARPLGKITGAFNRATLANNTTENRGGESTLGNLVAEIQRWATRNPESGSAQIALMNPGGLRDNLPGGTAGETAYPRTVTYKQAATVQPFANTLVNMDLTGAQLKTVLEQQWQPAGSSRPFLKLGLSAGFTYTYVPPAAGAPAGTKGVVTAMYLDGVALDPATTYSVTVNSFLASGGDNFFELAKGAGKQDTGKTDLQAQVDYFAAFASSTPLAVDSSQRGVGVSFPAGAPTTYAAGSTVSFALSSLSMTGAGDVPDSSVTVSLGDQVLTTAPVTTTRQTALPGFDEVGTATVSAVLPTPLPAGPVVLTVRGDKTGTVVRVPVSTAGAPTTPTTPTTTPTTPTTPPGTAPVRTTTTAKVKPQQVVADRTRPRVRITVRAADGTLVDGQAVIRMKGQKTITVAVVDGKAKIRLSKLDRAGRKTVTVVFLGGSSFTGSSASDTFRVRLR